MANASLDLGAAITRVTTAVGEQVLAARAASGISAIGLQVLRLAAGGATVGELTRILGVPKSTMTSVLGRLEALGLAERASDPDDGRRQIVRSTATGATRLRAFDDALERHVAELLGEMTPARRERLRVLSAKLPSASVPLPLSGPS